jgi:formylglycine-generating enzyme required for sulfatase activity/class 3 adenylate cyclase
MPPEDLKRKLSAILSADVVGYSRLMGDDESATIRTLNTYRDLMTTLIQQYRGRVVDAIGDNLLAEFGSAVDAVNCAVEIQRELAERNTELSDDRRMEFRIGANVGDVVEEQGRIYGDGVNIAARVEGLAKAGGICISGRVYDQVENKLDFTYVFLGEKKVKNIARPVRVYRVFSSPDAAVCESDFSQLERAYRERVKARYAEEAVYYVPLAGETTETRPCEPTKEPRTARRRRRRAKFEYHEWIPCGQDIKQVKLETLREAVEKYPCVILLGDPGCGKTTALENLAYQFSDHPDTLPVPLRLSEFDAGMRMEDFIIQGWGGLVEAGHWGAQELAACLETYLESGKLFILFDALNEMPLEGYRESSLALRRFIDRWSVKGNRFVVTCRILDYSEELSGLQRVEVQPLSDDQIRLFLQNELPEKWRALWQTLIRSLDRRHRLLEMARNPYLLTLMVDVFEEDSQLNENRVALMHRFTQILMSWAKAKCPPDQWLSVDVQCEALAVMAFEMQTRSGFGTKVKTEQVKAVMPYEVQLDPNWPPQPTPPDEVLSLAASAKIIEMPIDRTTVRFYHQLLQEYFAANQMLKLDPASLAHLWCWPWLEKEMPLWVRPESNYEPLPPPPTTGWEETTILAVGSAPENDHQLIRTLLQVNPVLAGRCLLQGQVSVDPATRQTVIDHLLATIANPEIALRVRIAAGDVLGYLGDPRPGAMVAIPGGEFLMGEGREQHELFLTDYQLGKYPLTNAEYARFIEAGGYQDKSLWTEAGWQEINQKKNQPSYWQDARFNKPNQPTIGLSWYECVAYCRWLSAQTGQLYRLPTEAEWEKGARGVDGRMYPWGNAFEAKRLNAREGDQKVCATTPVGVYPTGVSPFGLFDCAGNVWEWCATRWKKAFPYNVDQEEWQADYLEGKNLRALRSGSWNYKADVARCGHRFKFQPFGWTERGGCRLASPV